MKKEFLLMSILVVTLLFTIGCEKEVPIAETPNTMPPSIMVDGELYFSTGEEMPIEPDESEIRTVTSVINGSELPSKDGEINFASRETKYAKINDYEEYIVVLLDSEWVKFEKKVNETVNGTIDETTYDKVSTYMIEESKNAFSPYYELLEFIISNYKEEVVDGNIEATFFYTIIHKNYDKDPDTVDYIKEAKESGNKNYQQMYDEYLQPREMNFDFKVVIDENDAITLYSNISPHGIEWEETKMTDYILVN